MTMPAYDSSHRKDLQDLENLSRAPFLCYLQKQAQPRRARDKTLTSTPPKFPILASFAPTQLVKWIWEYLSHRLGPRHPFLTYAKSNPDQGVYKLEGDNEIRITLAGDWGTGTDEANLVAKLMAAYRPHYSIHLGDVYYVGDPAEVGENFLGIKNPLNDYEPCQWPAGLRGSFALNGNHEMYARGISYFDQMLPTLGLMSNGKPNGQKASYFYLENEHWRIIALDTGYNSTGWPLVEYIIQPDCALRPEEMDWLCNVVRPRDDDPRGIIILSHHQPFSRYDFWYPKQASQLAEFISRPVLWFWGHEHRMAIYQAFAAPGGIPTFGRCIGHGGMPVDLPPSSPKYAQCVIEFTDTRPYPNDENLMVGFNGFARMSLQDNRVAVEYVDVQGTVVFSEQWIVENGTLRRI